MIDAWIYTRRERERERGSRIITCVRWVNNTRVHRNCIKLLQLMNKRYKKTLWVFWWIWKRTLQKTIRCLNDPKASTFTFVLETLSKQFEMFLASSLTKIVSFGHYFPSWTPAWNSFANTYSNVKQLASLSKSRRPWHPSNPVTVVWCQ